MPAETQRGSNNTLRKQRNLPLKQSI